MNLYSIFLSLIGIFCFIIYKLCSSGGVYVNFKVGDVTNPWRSSMWSLPAVCCSP